jgi:GH25 family lysozyme M1 (1,4-beta-N-acetylmuramidase)
VDRYAPVFLTVKNATIKVGGTFDIHKYIGYADDVDRNVTMEMSGSVDTSKAGTYPVKITLTDDAGHQTSKSIDVKVIESSSSGGSSGGGGGGKKDEFADFIKNYKTDATSLGIDVSRWQENIDFNKVKAAGCEFVIIRLGGYDNGEHYTDKYYKANIANAKAAGLKVGIYWHAEESSREEVKASVNYLLSVLGDNTLDFPIAYDWEDYINFEQYGMNLRDLTECFYAFAEELQARGYAVCLYGSKNSHMNIWQNDRKYPEWLAHYTAATNYEGDYYMWQHSSTGKIDGINGDVDLDVLYVDKWKKVMGY